MNILKTEFHKVQIDAEALEKEIMALCPNLAEVKVLEKSIYPGGAQVISNCKCGGNRSMLTIPCRELRSIHKDDMAAYAAYSLQRCRRMFGDACPHRPENAVSS